VVYLYRGGIIMSRTSFFYFMEGVL